MSSRTVHRLRKTSIQRIRTGWGAAKVSCAMSVVQSLWASVQGNPVFMRRVNGWLAIFWVAMIPVSVFTGWINSVTYVAALSLWALVSGHWSAWQAARVEVEQMKEAELTENRDVAGEVVERIVDETDVAPTAPSPQADSE